MNVVKAYNCEFSKFSYHFRLFVLRSCLRRNLRAKIPIPNEINYGENLSKILKLSCQRNIRYVWMLPWNHSKVEIATFGYRT